MYYILASSRKTTFFIFKITEHQKGSLTLTKVWRTYRRTDNDNTVWRVHIRGLDITIRKVITIIKTNTTYTITYLLNSILFCYYRTFRSSPTPVGFITTRDSDTGYIWCLQDTGVTIQLNERTVLTVFNLFLSCIP